MYIQKFQYGKAVNPKLYDTNQYKQYIKEHGSDFVNGFNSYVPGFYVYYNNAEDRLKFYRNPYPYKVEHSAGSYSKLYDKTGTKVIDIVPYGSVVEITPEQSLDAYTDKYGRYVPAKPDMKSKRFWEIDKNKVRRYNKKKYGGTLQPYVQRFKGGKVISNITEGLAWWGREFKNLFRGITENRKPSEYNSTTQTFKGDGAELKGGNFGGSGGGGEWPKPESKIRPEKKLLEPIFSIETETFNDAFADARKKGKPTFWFNGKLYNTKLGGGAEAQKAGAQRRRISGIRIHGALPEQ